jgi:hypothetical protein
MQAIQSRSSNSHVQPGSPDRPGPPSPMFNRVLQIVQILQLPCSTGFSRLSRSSNSHVQPGSPDRTGPGSRSTSLQILQGLHVLQSLQSRRHFFCPKCPPSLSFSFPPVHPGPPILCFLRLFYMMVFSMSQFCEVQKACILRPLIFTYNYGAENLTYLHVDGCIIFYLIFKIQTIFSVP